MAQKKKATATTKKNTETTKVTRITAKDDVPAKAKKPATKADATDKAVKSKEAPKKEVKEKKSVKQDERKGFFAAIGGYFKGAWYELRQVRWPNRRTTWGLTLAVIAFTAFFVALIVLLDFGFQWLFDQILG